jgi:hypothetical protein
MSRTAPRPRPDAVPPQPSVPSAVQLPPPGKADAPLTAEAIGLATAQGIGQQIGPLLNAFLQLVQALPNLIGQAVAAAQPQDMCADCLTERMTWEAAHGSQLETAFQCACQAAGIPPDPNSPQARSLDVTPFLPEHLQGTNADSAERMPQIQNAATMVNGKRVCPGHVIPGGGGGARLLVASGNFTPAMPARAPR